MSLVGSLEDLGLGDILQIVSLSRKSGLLLIHSDEGEGRIVFCDGLVRAAFVKGEAEDLRALLVTTGFVTSEEFDRADELARARAEALDEVIPELTGLSKERLDSLRREHVERTVFRIFSFRGGEFSFEVRDEIDARDCQILLPTGVNAQYLTMEATRLGDENERGIDERLDTPGELAPEPDFDPIGDDGPFFSGEDEVGSESEARPVSEAPEWPPAVDEVCSTHEVVALAAARRECATAEEDAAESAPVVETAVDTAAEFAAPTRVADRACLIAIDPMLDTLEWQKSVLVEIFARVHIFQSVDSGVARIRQYLGRGQVPVVLVSSDIPPDPVTGESGIAEFIRRLKIQAPFMPVLVTERESTRSDPVAAADAVIRQPDSALLANRRVWDRLEESAQRFRDEVAVWLERPIEDVSQGDRPTANAMMGAHAKGLRRLREVSEKIRDPDNRGEVLSLVLKFAAESFPRVAMFMVRDDAVVGMAQRGLPSAGGPDDDAFRNLELRPDQIDAFERVLESRTALRATPGPGDEIWPRLGEAPPAEFYVAPIESGDRVVALLYADTLPERASIGETTILEIALHEAGLALERALLKHALARIGEESET